MRLTPVTPDATPTLRILRRMVEPDDSQAGRYLDREAYRWSAYEMVYTDSADEAQAQVDRLNANAITTRDAELAKGLHYDYYVYALSISYDLTEDWQRRENGKPYQPVPWSSASWFRDYYNAHFPHLSTAQPGMIAFTLSPEHGKADRQTVMKPGRYLTRYCSEWINQANIDAYCASVTEESAPGFFKLAKTSDDIERVYLNGPTSCMSKRVTHEDIVAHIHPTRVYGAGDLALAYLERNERIVARCIVWPERKMFARIYGDSDRMMIALKGNGYSVDGRNFGSNANDTDSDMTLWDGARLLKVAGKSGGYVCPYLDMQNRRVLVEREFLVISKDNPSRRETHYANDTNGMVGYEKPDDDDCDDDSFVCELCNGRYNLDDSDSTPNGDRVCNDCWNEAYFCCYYCGQTTGHDDSVTVITRYSDRYYGVDQTRSYCGSCADDHQHCAICESYYHTDIGMARMVDDTDICPLCIKAAGVKRRPCGHYATDYQNSHAIACEVCGQHCPVKLVCTGVIFSNRVTV